MLDKEQRFFLARHLLRGVERLEETLLNPEKTAFRQDAREWLQKEGIPAKARILGLAAMDVYDQSAGTLLGDAIRDLDEENFGRLANAIRALM